MSVSVSENITNQLNVADEEEALLRLSNLPLKMYMWVFEPLIELVTGLSVISIGLESITCYTCSLYLKNIKLCI